MFHTRLTKLVNDQNQLLAEINASYAQMEIASISLLLLRREDAYANDMKLLQKETNSIGDAKDIAKLKSIKTSATILLGKEKERAELAKKVTAGGDKFNLALSPENAQTRVNPFATELKSLTSEFKKAEATIHSMSPDDLATYKALGEHLKLAETIQGKFENLITGYEENYSTTHDDIVLLTEKQGKQFLQETLDQVNDLLPPPTPVAHNRYMINNNKTTASTSTSSVTAAAATADATAGEETNCGFLRCFGK